MTAKNRRKQSARPAMRKMNNQRKTFTGDFIRYGTKPAWGGGEPDKTILLQNIVDSETGETVTDHLWFNYTKGFRLLGVLTKGDRVKFDARVKEYWKGYMGHREEILYSADYKPPEQSYKLSHPTKISKIRRQPPAENGDKYI